MKFDFQNSSYSKLWDSSEGRTILTALLQDKEMIRSNFNFWREKFTVDPNITPTNADGTATFVSKMRKLQASTMMHMRAPLGDSIPRDKNGIAFYTGVIPDFISDGFVEQAMEREYKEQQFIDNFGSDAMIVAQFADELQSLIDSADQTLSNMSAQILSKGSITYNYGQGIKGNIYKADIPAENFLKAGEKVWTAPDCKLLDQMVDIEKDVQDSIGLAIPMIWELPYKMFHDTFLKNSQVVDWVKEYRTVNDMAVTDTLRVTENMFRQAIADYEGLSPIVVIEEKQKDYTGVVHGWKDNVAVLRPAGFAGMVRHTSILDQKMYEKYGASAIQRTFAKTEDGLYTVMNTVLDNGNLKEWHTDLMMACIPSLDEFLYHYIIDTNTAND